MMDQIMTGLDRVNPQDHELLKQEFQERAKDHRFATGRHVQFFWKGMQDVLEKVDPTLQIPEKFGYEHLIEIAFRRGWITRDMLLGQSKSASETVSPKAERARRNAARRAFLDFVTKQWRYGTPQYDVGMKLFALLHREDMAEVPKEYYDMAARGQLAGSTTDRALNAAGLDSLELLPGVPVLDETGRETGLRRLRLSNTFPGVPSEYRGGEARPTVTVQVPEGTDTPREVELPIVVDRSGQYIEGVVRKANDNRTFFLEVPLAGGGSVQMDIKQTNNQYDGAPYVADNKIWFTRSAEEMGKSIRTSTGYQHPTLGGTGLRMRQNQEQLRARGVMPVDVINGGHAEWWQRGVNGRQMDALPASGGAYTAQWGARQEAKAAEALRAQRQAEYREFNQGLDARDISRAYQSVLGELLQIQRFPYNRFTAKEMLPLVRYVTQRHEDAAYRLAEAKQYAADPGAFDPVRDQIRQVARMQDGLLALAGMQAEKPEQYQGEVAQLKNMEDYQQSIRLEALAQRHSGLVQKGKEAADQSGTNVLARLGRLIMRATSKGDKQVKVQTATTVPTEPKASGTEAVGRIEQPDVRESITESRILKSQEIVVQDWDKTFAITLKIPKSHSPGAITIPQDMGYEEVIYKPGSRSFWNQNAEQVLERAGVELKVNGIGNVVLNFRRPGTYGVVLSSGQPGMTGQLTSEWIQVAPERIYRSEQRERAQAPTQLSVSRPGQRAHFRLEGKPADYLVFQSLGQAWTRLGNDPTYQYRKNEKGRVFRWDEAEKQMWYYGEKGEWVKIPKNAIPARESSQKKINSSAATAPESLPAFGVEDMAAALQKQDDIIPKVSNAFQSIPHMPSGGGAFVDGNSAPAETTTPPVRPSATPNDVESPQPARSLEQSDKLVRPTWQLDRAVKEAGIAKEVVDTFNKEYGNLVKSIERLLMDGSQAALVDAVNKANALDDGVFLRKDLQPMRPLTLALRARAIRAAAPLQEGDTRKRWETIAANYLKEAERLGGGGVKNSLQEIRREWNRTATSHTHTHADSPPPTTPVPEISDDQRIEDLESQLRKAQEAMRKNTNADELERQVKTLQSEIKKLAEKKTQ